MCRTLEPENQIQEPVYTLCMFLTFLSVFDHFVKLALKRLRFCPSEAWLKFTRIFFATSHGSFPIIVEIGGPKHISLTKQWIKQLVEWPKRWRLFYDRKSTCKSIDHVYWTKKTLFSLTSQKFHNFNFHPLTLDLHVIMHALDKSSDKNILIQE